MEINLPVALTEEIRRKVNSWARKGGLISAMQEIHIAITANVIDTGVAVGPFTLIEFKPQIIDFSIRKSYKIFGLKDETNMTNLFPPDQMQYGLGSEIIVEVSGLFVKPERTFEVKQLLGSTLGEAIKALYPKAKVEVFVITFNQEQDAFWVSK